MPRNQADPANRSPAGSAHRPSRTSPDFWLIGEFGETRRLDLRRAATGISCPQPASTRPKNPKPRGNGCSGKKAESADRSRNCHHHLDWPRQPLGWWSHRDRPPRSDLTSHRPQKSNQCRGGQRLDCRGAIGQIGLFPLNPFSTLCRSQSPPRRPASGGMGRHLAFPGIPRRTDFFGGGPRSECLTDTSLS